MAFSSCLKFYPFSISQAKTLTHYSFSLKLNPPSSTISFASPNSAALSSSDVKLLDSLRSQADDSAALRLFNLASKQPNFSPEPALYEEILLRLGRSGSFDDMRKILEDMKNSGCEMGTSPFLILIESYAQFELQDEILGVVHWMIDEFGLKPDTHFYNRMLNLLVDGNNLKLVEIAHAKMSVWGIKPDVSTFNVLIKALCRAHQLRPAILMLEDMPSYGLVPDEKTFTTIMQGYIEEGDLDGALRIREQMVEFGCSWSNVSVNVIVHGFCKEGRVEDALNFIQEMSNEGGFFPDQYTFNTLVNGLCKAGHVKHAIEIMDVMLQEGRVEDASQLMDQMIMEGQKPDKFTYNSLLTHFCRGGDIKKAADIVQAMTSNGCEPDIVTYGTLISGLCKAGRVEVASKLLRSIQMKGIALTPHAYNPVIQGLFRKRKTTEAINLFREMLEQNEAAPDAVSYRIVFRGLCNGGGPIREAVDFLVELLEKGFVPEFSSLYMLAEGLLTLSMEETLVKLVNMVMQKARFSEEEVSMVKGLLKIRKFQDALATLGGVLDSRQPRRTYRSR
ncbi:unnamed protein product [Arabidopsis arenosa]|uniref:Pentatricopeptide repeat-containing protein n=1 Tax=Arabidopsis arenosa TaxID=38785 RepID=A0A8S2AIF8_ARAAE|nr:unnamed protein product [Arabidopsis arenosa]